MGQHELPCHEVLENKQISLHQKRFVNPSLNFNKTRVQCE